jgi:hypothetical protein
MAFAAVGMVTAPVLDVSVLFRLVHKAVNRNTFYGVSEVRLFSAALGAALFAEYINMVFLAVLAAIELQKAASGLLHSPLPRWVIADESDAFKVL